MTLAESPINIRVMPQHQSGSDQGCLARFHFVNPAIEAAGDCDHNMTLAVIDGPSLCEEWRIEGAIEHGVRSGIRYSLTADFLLLSWTDKQERDARRQSRDLYRRLLDLTEVLERPHIIKAWNHLPEINIGEGDMERYRQFCLGRAEAFDGKMGGRPMPAGTAVGSAPDQPMQVMLLAGRNPPSPVENPRQISAYRYPRQYGPRGPSFSRASLVGKRQLFVSGTAAIVGHESRHGGNIENQIQETISNWRALLNQAADLNGLQKPGLKDVQSFRVYLKEPYCHAIASRVLAAAGVCPDRVVYLEAAICRSELAFELDGVVDYSHE